MNRYWTTLLGELEKRVELIGHRLPNKEKIKFVTPKTCEGKSRSFNYTVPIYDMHSLRVSLITAFAERGVPIAVLSKFIAGHASVVMTLYYNKSGPAYITSVMNAASQKLEEVEQENYRRFLMDHAHKQIAEVAAFNDETAIHALKHGDPGAWVTDDRGICPTGCSRCHEGGEMKGATSSSGTVKDVFDPVPGGQNCVMCRFFITGPAFLTGLIAHFNEVGWRLMEKSQKYREFEQRIENLEEARYLCEIEDQPFLLGGELEAVGKLYQREGDAVDLLAKTWHATKRLIDRCLATQRGMTESEGAERSTMVLSGTRADIQAALVETTAFELADAVCQSAVFYESVDATLPTLRRADMINAMLAVNHRRPVFATLSDEQRLHIGNELVKLLVARVGLPDTLALMAGEETLERLEFSHQDLGRDMDAMLAATPGQPFQMLTDASGKRLVTPLLEVIAE